MNTYQVTIRHERGRLQIVARSSDGTVDARMSSIGWLSGEYSTLAHCLYKDECIVSAEMLPDGSCIAEIVDIPEIPDPQWQPRPTCAGLWVYRVENKFWLQSIVFYAVYLYEDRIADWKPMWDGDLEIKEVYGPLQMSPEGQNQWDENEKKSEERFKKEKS